jgi:hypothetical protein
VSRARKPRAVTTDEQTGCRVSPMAATAVMVQDEVSRDAWKVIGMEERA